MPNKEPRVMIDNASIYLADVFSSHKSSGEFASVDELIDSVSSSLRKTLDSYESGARKRLRKGMVPATPFTRIYLDYDWDDDAVLRVEYFREKTEAEHEADRIREERDKAAEAARKEAVQQRERKEYERLKKKYG